MKKTLLLIGLAGALCATATLRAANDTNTAEAATVAAPTTTGDDQPLPPPPPDDAAAPDNNAAPPAPADVSAPSTPSTPATTTPSTPSFTPAVTSPSAPVYVPDTNVIVPVPTGVRGLHLNFRNAPLEAVLNYMSAAAGFIIHPKTDISGKVTVWSEQPLTSDEAVKLLTRILNDNGYTLLPEGRTLTIIRTSDARFNNIPVIVNPDPATIPTTADIVTQIIPVHSLNVVQLVKDLDPLRPPDTTITADDSANSLVITGTQANIHRFAQIIAGLDSVNSSSATVKVYPLKYADSKALATLITSLFPTPDSQGGRGGGGGGLFGRFRGGGGGGFNPFGGGGGGGGDDAVNNGHTPTAKVTAVSDDHSNSLVVSVPDSLIATIDDLVAQVDTAVENSTIMKVFHLKNADPSEMADLLTALYPDDTGSADASQTRFGFGGFPFGNRGGRQQNSSNAESDRMKKMAHVSAVADKRTSSLVVTADTNVMDQIQVMIDDLDARNDRKMAVHIIPLDYADPIDVQTILQDIYPATSAAGGSSRIGSSSASSTSNPLLNRANTLLQQQNNTSQSSAFGSGATGGTGKAF